MDGTATIREEKFLRPRGRGGREERGGEGFQEILKRVFRVAFRLLLLLLLLFVGHSGYGHLLEDPFFRVREIEVEGCQKMAKETLLSHSFIEGMPNIFTFRLEGIAKRLEGHPWVEYVVVRKIFPDKVLIQVKERKPIAILQLEELYYLDANGVIFSPMGDGDGYNYPFLTGLSRSALERDPVEGKHLVTKALEFLRIADKEKAPPLGEISEIRMERTFGVYCITKAEGLEVRMGWDHFREKLRRLSILWSDLQKRGHAAASIDCSDLKRMVVKNISKN